MMDRQLHLYNSPSVLNKKYMKIVLIGCGKMGQAIEKLAKKKGHELILKVNSENCKSISANDIEGADVAIEFTRPEVTYDNIMLCFEADVPVVCGTTGWTDKLSQVEKYAQQNGKTFFYSPNFSIGVNLFFEVNKLLARLMDKQPIYDEVLIHESHHTGKLDSPSGTAITLAKQVINEMERITEWVNYKADENVNIGTDNEKELPIFSTREEDVPGTHIVKYFSDVDEIEIIHKALNREGFAQGALMAAEWLKDKKGVYGMSDLLKL
jgi:4-hydroxy-tetrahydrodipicolinate reductase